uniref:Uncharacterized protein n=1 Tax=Clastoptera arizonana TaxID=38151 RepID=A0A1B6DM29_9HEMI
MDIPKNIDNDTIDTKISNEEITQDNSINISKNEENFVENETNDKKEFEIVSESKINVDGPDYEKLSNDILVAREDDIDKTNGQNKTFFEEGQETNNENQIIEIKTEDTIKDHEKLEDNSLQENDNQYHFEETASIKGSTSFINTHASRYIEYTIGVMCSFATPTCDVTGSLPTGLAHRNLMKVSNINNIIVINKSF